MAQTCLTDTAVFECNDKNLLTGQNAVFGCQPYTPLTPANAGVHNEIRNRFRALEIQKILKARVRGMSGKRWRAYDVTATSEIALTIPSTTSSTRNLSSPSPVTRITGSVPDARTIRRP